MDLRSDRDHVIADDVRTLERMGYRQELHRRMNAFSNFAISFSIICILAGGLTSFHLGFCSVGGAAIGIGWPLVCIFSLMVAATMGQVASAFPTAGGLYHWAAILGGRGWGWITAWFNLLGLITVLAAINVGTYHFITGSLGPALGWDVSRLSPQGQLWSQIIGVALITTTQALFNHLGIRVTTLLTDFSGYLILVLAAVLTVALLVAAGNWDLARLATFTNYSGLAGGDTLPATSNLWLLFAMGFLLPAYTITGFDASAHTSEETVGAARSVPLGIVRSVAVSGIAGWIMTAAIVLAMPDPNRAAAEGGNVFFWTVEQVLPVSLARMLFVGISIAQYLCGLATVTSASRMTFAFARDGGLPFSDMLRRVSIRFKTPAVAVWAVAILAILFTVYTPVYSTITAVCVIFLYISYVLPTALGFVTYGRQWMHMGPWSIGRWYRPLALFSVVGCAGLIVISVLPPNDRALRILGATLVVMGVVWTALERRRFQGPPVIRFRGADANAPKAGFTPLAAVIPTEPS